MSVGPSVVLAMLAFALVALAALVATTRTAARRPRVLCLMYHRVVPRATWEGLRGAERIFSMPEDAFDAQMGWLRAAGWSFVDAAVVAAFARGEVMLPDRSTLVTLDDGCASVHAHAMPVLRRHGAMAVAFITTDPESAIFRESGEGERRMSDDEIRELAAADVTIGSHAVSHRPLSAMSEDEIRRELEDSKRTLEGILGRPIDSFAVPANWYDARVLRIAHEVGYAAVYCSLPGTVRRGAGAFPLPRINVEGHLDLDGFARTLSPVFIAQRLLVMTLRAWPKRVVGPRTWTLLRDKVFPWVGGHWLSPSRMAAVAVAIVVLGLVLAVGWLLATG